MIRAALDLAMAFDRARLVVPAKDGSSSGCACLAEPPEVVHVLAAAPGAVGSSAVVHEMRKPHMRFAACSCAAAKQRKMCHHQVAFLMVQSQNPPAARNLIIKVLGMRFGYFGGCHVDDISPAWDGLRAQAPAALGPGLCRVTRRSADVPAPAFAAEPAVATAALAGAACSGGQPALLAAPSAAAPPGADAPPGATAPPSASTAPPGATTAVAAAPAVPREHRLMGDVAKRNLEGVVCRAVTQALANFHAAPAEAQLNVASQLESFATAIVSMTADAARGARGLSAGIDFDNTRGRQHGYRRVPGPLERKTSGKRSASTPRHARAAGRLVDSSPAAILQSAAPAANRAVRQRSGSAADAPARSQKQADFAHATALNVRKPPTRSEPWRGTISMREAAGNAQSFLDQRRGTKAGALASSSRSAAAAVVAPPASQVGIRCTAAPHM